MFNLYNQNLLPIQTIHFTHLQQYDENCCVYRARIGRHSKKPRKRDHNACSAQNYLDLLNLDKC